MLEGVGGGGKCCYIVLEVIVYIASSAQCIIKLDPACRGGISGPALLALSRAYRLN